MPAQRAPLRIKAVRWEGKLATDAARKAAMTAIRQCARDLLGEANDKCPHNEGTLMRSGVWSTDEGTLEGAVSYDTPYAVRLHEHPEYNFQQGKEGKWLENAANRRSQDYLDWISKAIDEALK